MKILLYDYVELEERGAKSYKLWRGCHIASYVLAAVFGVLNFYFLEQTMILFGDQCVLDPHTLLFKNATALPTNTSALPTNAPALPTNASALSTAPSAPPLSAAGDPLPTAAALIAQGDTTVAPEEATTSVLTQSDTTLASDETSSSVLAPGDTTHAPGVTPVPQLPPPSPQLTLYNETVEIVNVTAFKGSFPVRIVDLDASQFQLESYCDMALYTPLLSTIFGIVWCTMFVVCSAGGRSEHGFSEPWRIVVPAMLFALVLVFLAGHSFLATNRGLQALCHEFYNVTNTTSCTRGMDAHVEAAYGAWATPSAAVGATRAFSAGVWACWAAACALLLARCLAAADFSTLLPLLKERRKQAQVGWDDAENSARSPPDSPLAAPHDDSGASEPTSSTELNTVSLAPVDVTGGGKSLNDMAADSTPRARNGQYIELLHAPRGSSAT